MIQIFYSILFFVLFWVLTLAFYAVFFLIDNSTFYFMIFRALIMLSGVFYFYMLIEHVTYLKKATEYTGTFFVAFCLCMFYIALVIDFGGEKLKTKLLKSSYGETIATIKNCYSSEGSEYCLYSYSLSTKHYEIKYCNEYCGSRDTLKKFNEGDKVTIVYYPKFPVLSKLKNFPRLGHL